jgi:hypothetical protein
MIPDFIPGPSPVCPFLPLGFVNFYIAKSTVLLNQTPLIKPFIASRLGPPRYIAIQGKIGLMGYWVLTPKTPVNYRVFQTLTEVENESTQSSVA